MHDIAVFFKEERVWKIMKTTSLVICTNIYVDSLIGNKWLFAKISILPLITNLVNIQHLTTI